MNARTHACLYMRGACSHALTEDVFFLIAYAEHWLLDEFACLAGGQFTAQLDIAELLRQPPCAQRVTLGLFPWYKVCSTSLSLYWLGLL